MQVNISNRALEAALRAERNAAKPVIKLSARELAPGNIEVTYKNVGPGPALRFQCRIVKPPYNYDVPLQVRGETAVGTGEENSVSWEGREGEERLPRLKEGFHIVAQYEDIFDSLFESRLIIENEVSHPRMVYECLEDKTRDLRCW